MPKEGGGDVELLAISLVTHTGGFLYANVQEGGGGIKWSLKYISGIKHSEGEFVELLAISLVAHTGEGFVCIC